MKPSERFEACVICGLAILLASFAFLPPSWLPKWIGDSGDVRFLGWFMLTGLCLAAIGVVRDWAKRFRSKWLLLLAVPPAAVLTYEVWFFVKLLTVGLLKEVKEVTLGQWLLFIWAIVTLRFWYQRNEYKEQLESAEAALYRQPSRCPHCGAHLESSTQGKMLKEAQQELARNKQAGTGHAAAMLAIVRDPALFSRFKTADAATQQQMLAEAARKIPSERPTE